MSRPARARASDSGLVRCRRSQAADLEQLESECLDLGQHAVQRGLVRNTFQQCVATSCLGAQGRERASHRRTQMAADTDLVARWPLTAGADRRLSNRSLMAG